MTHDHMAWFREARFGMFIHWGLYSLLERGEWVMHLEAIPRYKYEQLADRFNPAPDCARTWAKLAKRAGMKYAVLTTKHHDGYCLFHSEFTDYNAVDRGPGRDLVREYVEAFRAEGIRVGLYFSLGDWHFPPYLAVSQGDRSQTKTLRDFIHGQVRELMTNYGKIDLLWYDGAWFDDEYLSAETLDSAGLNAMARALQPGLVINERAGTTEDYVTCENECKPAPMGTDWEMCICINDIWGYSKYDYNYKTVNQLIFNIVNCASQGGNFLLNIGPRGNGEVPGEQIARLEAVGRWLDIHGESVYSTTRLPAPFFGGGRMTRKDNRLYLHTFYWPGTTMRVPKLHPQAHGVTPGVSAVKAHVLTTGQPACAAWDGDVLVISDLPAAPPDQADTVVVIEV